MIGGIVITNSDLKVQVEEPSESTSNTTQN